MTKRTKSKRHFLASTTTMGDAHKNQQAPHSHTHLTRNSKKKVTGHGNGLTAFNSRARSNCVWRRRRLIRPLGFAGLYLGAKKQTISSSPPPPPLPKGQRKHLFLKSGIITKNERCGAFHQSLLLQARIGQRNFFHIGTHSPLMVCVANASLILGSQLILLCSCSQRSGGALTKNGRASLDLGGAQNLHSSRSKVHFVAFFMHQQIQLTTFVAFVLFEGDEEKCQ